MSEQGDIILSSEELAVLMVLSGYEELANQILESRISLNDENRFNYFIKSVEDSLRIKGYLDETRESMLKEEIEDFIQLLVHSQRKVRIISGSKVSFLHQLVNKGFLFQEIKSDLHMFKLIPTFKANVLEKIFERRGDKTQNAEGTAIRLNNKTFDQLLNMSIEELNILYLHDSTGIELKKFIKDLISNKHTFDNISFMTMDLNRDIMNILEVQFYISGKEERWVIDYSKIEFDEIYIISKTDREFYLEIEAGINDFFSESFTRSS